MKIIKTPFLPLLVVVLLFGCVYKEGIQQPDQNSYIWFSGNTDGSIAIIDGGEPFKVEIGHYYNDQTDTGRVDKKGRTLYQVKPGRHEIIVKNGSEIRVNRIVLIGSGATKEINIP